jgi:hypothetical protein
MKLRNFYESFLKSFVNIHPDLYRKQDPPYRADGIDLSIKINLEIISIGAFQEIEMTFSVKFLIQLEW